MKIVDIEEFIKSDDYQNCFNYIHNTIVEEVSASIRTKMQGDLVDFGNNPEVLNYMVKYQVPFFDITIPVAIKKDDELYVDIDTYTYGMNCQMKSLFLRKYWKENSKDDLVNFMWDHYTQGQYNGEFDILAKKAKIIFDECETVYEFTKRFVYNKEYEFITKNDIIENFEELIKNEALVDTYRKGEFYKMDTNFRYYRENCDVVNPKEQELLEAYFYSKFYDRIQNCKSKFNYLPSLKMMSKKDCMRKLKGRFMSSRLGKQLMLNMQFLMFY